MSKEEVVALKNHTLLDEETLAWLNQFASYPLNDRQRLALVYLRANVQMTNADYRRLHNDHSNDRIVVRMSLGHP